MISGSHYKFVANRQQVKCLPVIGEYTREYLAINVVGSIRFQPHHRSARQTRQCLTAHHNICVRTMPRHLLPERARDG